MRLRSARLSYLIMLIILVIYCETAAVYWKNFTKFVQTQNTSNVRKCFTDFRRIYH